MNIIVLFNCSFNRGQSSHITIYHHHCRLFFYCNIVYYWTMSPFLVIVYGVILVAVLAQHQIMANADDTASSSSSYDSLVSSQCKARCVSLYPWKSSHGGQQQQQHLNSDRRRHRSAVPIIYLPNTKMVRTQKTMITKIDFSLQIRL